MLVKEEIIENENWSQEFRENDIPIEQTLGIQLKEFWDNLELEVPTLRTRKFSNRLAYDLSSGVRKQFKTKIVGK